MTEDNVIVDQIAAKKLAYIQQTFNFSEIKENKNTISNLTPEYQSVKDLRSELFEISWWINRALILALPYKGQCTRIIKITNQTEKNYFEMGKIFRFQNIISATNDKYLKDPLTMEDPDPDIVYFHI